MTYHICFLLLLLSCLGSASAAEISDSLRAVSADKFADFHYRAYNFSALPTTNKFQIIMRSREFDAYLMVVKPDGTILTNDDDQSNRDQQTATDARIAVDNPVVGTWLVVATSLSEAAEGDYKLIYDGFSSLEPLRSGDDERSKIAAAFSARDVNDPRALVEALAEELTLGSFRAHLTRRLQAEIGKLDSSNESVREELRALEDKERQLTNALTSVNALTGVNDPRSIEVIRSALGEALKVTKDKIESLAGTLVKSVSERNAFAAALGELGQLDSVADELKRSEESLLAADVPSAPGNDVRRGITRLRGQRELLGRAIAKKLLDSRILSDVWRFGRLIFPDEFPHWAGGVPASTAGGTGSVGAEIDPAVWLPALLPWPPPDPSSRVVLGQYFFLWNGVPSRTLGELDDRLQMALSRAGYSGSTYWGVPGGFAIVTPLEQTYENGAPLSGNLRWLASVKEMKSFSLAEYLNALFTAPPGYFRVLVFLTSCEPFASSGSKAKLETIERWSGGGLNVLPEIIRREAFTEQHRVTVLVYEFMKRKDADHPETSVPGRLPARDHLLATNLSLLLGG